MSLTYQRAVDCLEHWLTMNDRFVIEFVKELGTKPEEERLIWASELSVLKQAHLFEFPPRIAQMLAQTDNKPHPVKLPFPNVYIDCEFNLENTTQFGGENRYYGVLLTQAEGATHATATSFMSAPIAIKLTEDNTGDPHNLEQYTNGKPLLKGVSTRTNLKMEHPINVAYPVGTGYEQPGPHMSQYARAEWKALQTITLNFLDLLETPDVILVPAHRKGKRRERLGLSPLPPGDRVVLRPNLVRYLDQMDSEQRKWSHRWWVRGHFRHFRDERYAASGKQDTTTWIYPYVKGEGILVQKKYVMPEGERSAVDPNARVSLSPEAR
jgi:hypothetical protein